MRFNGYGHPDNFDITNRPSNASLTRGIIARFILSAGPGAVLLPLLYTWIMPGQFESGVAIVLCAVGAVLGMALYLPFHIRLGRRQRREFVAAGGDATGISTFQFGSMGGKTLPDGRWQWSEETISAV